ncbi:MAG: hypothetical protein GY953_28815, partial [bacterium]|nr:hypothetical protein [bacterium]
MIWITSTGSCLAVDAEGFRLTFGWKRQAHGRAWSGGVRNPGQVRRVLGWHLDTEDRILPGGRWQLTLRIAGGQVHPKGVVLEVVSPAEQPVTFSTRSGDFSFVPAAIPYGRIHEIAGLDGDVRVERVPLPTTVSNTDYENDDPALLRTRAGEYWLAWVGYQTRSRSGHLIEGGDRVLVSRSRDGTRWSTPKPVTEFGDHFRVALAEDARGRVWCVYSLQREPESGNFDLYARTHDGTRWSPETQLTSNPFPDVFHKLAADSRGNLYLAWTGFRQRSSTEAPQSDVLVRAYRNGSWGDEIN